MTETVKVNELAEALNLEIVKGMKQVWNGQSSPGIFRDRGWN